MKNIENKVAFITGAASGIGYLEWSLAAGSTSSSILGENNACNL